eukprot:763438-Hanusia_phi.AAC.1
MKAIATCAMVCVCLADRLTAFNVGYRCFTSNVPSRHLSLRRDGGAPRTSLVSLEAIKRTKAKKWYQETDRNSEEYKQTLERQRLLTDSMMVLEKWDEDMREFYQKYADATAPLGDVQGLTKVAGAEQRRALREACKMLSSEAYYVLLGMNAETEEAVRRSFKQWIEGLQLPMPEQVPYMDDSFGDEFVDRKSMSEELQQKFDGPVHLAYNSKAGEAEDAPPRVHIMPYPAMDRGTVFTPILEGFFTQYGEIPLDLFDVAMDEKLQEGYEKVDASVRSEDVAARQHAELGNVFATPGSSRTTEQTLPAESESACEQAQGLLDQASSSEFLN